MTAFLITGRNTLPTTGPTYPGDREGEISSKSSFPTKVKERPSGGEMVASEGGTACSLPLSSLYISLG